MKKMLLLLLCQLTIQSYQSQNWWKPGATWHFKHFYIGPVIGNPSSFAINGVSDFKYVSDTIVNGFNCKHLNGKFLGYYSSGNVTFNNFKNYFLYENNQVVYGWSPSGNSFDTLVNFNAAIGNKWRSNTLLGICNGRGTIEVTDTGRVQINNLSLKKIVARYSKTFMIDNTTTYTMTMVDTIIERIGSRVNFIFPMYCLNDLYTNQTDIPYVYNGEFKCYQDNNFNLYKKAGVTSCEYDVSVGELSRNLLPVKIYPNPASGNLTLESDALSDKGSYNIQVLNVLGQQVSNEEIKISNRQLKIDIEHLNSGIYYLQLRDKNRLLVSEKIVKN
jgi:hypothetical protein